MLFPSKVSSVKTVSSFFTLATKKPTTEGRSVCERMLFCGVAHRDGIAKSEHLNNNFTACSNHVDITYTFLQNLLTKDALVKSAQN